MFGTDSGSPSCHAGLLGVCFECGRGQLLSDFGCGRSLPMNGFGCGKGQPVALSYDSTFNQSRVKGGWMTNRGT